MEDEVLAVGCAQVYADCLQAAVTFVSGFPILFPKMGVTEAVERVADEYFERAMAKGWSGMNRLRHPRPL